MTGRPRLVQGNVSLVDQSGNPVGTTGNPLSEYTADLTNSGTINGVGQTVGLTLGSGQSEIGFYLSGTFVGTVVFESSEDGVNFSSRVCRTSGVLNNLQTSTSKFPSEWRGVAAGMLIYRVRCTAYTSGTTVNFIGASIKAISPAATRTNQTTTGGATWTNSDFSIGSPSALNAPINVGKIGFLNTSTDAGTGLIDVIGGTGGSAPYNRPLSITLATVGTFSMTGQIAVSAISV